MATEFQFFPGLDYTLAGRDPWLKWAPAFAGVTESGYARSDNLL